MFVDAFRWSHPRGNEVVPSRWQATLADAVSMLDRTAVEHEMAQRICVITGVDVAGIGQFENGHLVQRTWVGITRRSGLLNLVVPSGLGLGGICVQSLGPVWVSNYLTSNLITHDFDGPVRGEGVQGMLAVPIVFGDRILGMTYAGVRRRAHFGDVAIDKMQQIAEATAAGIIASERSESRTRVALSEDRRRLSVALHDSVGGMLFRVGAGLQDLRANRATDAVLVGRLEELQEQIAQTSSALRASLAALNSTTPLETFAVAVQGDCREFEARTGIPTKYIALTETPELDDSRLAALVSAVREALLNVEKHAQASSVVVTSSATRDSVLVAVSDDGRGLDMDAQHDDVIALGIEASRERLQRVGGELLLTSNEGEGFTMRAVVPVAWPGGVPG